MPTNPYNTQSISGYNASPPDDTGAEVASNQLNWSKHIAKIGDPVRVLAQAINTQLLTAFGKVINIDDEQNNAMGGALAFTESTLTISAGSVTATRSAHIIAAQSGSTDDLDNITTGSVSDGTILHIRAASGETITVKHAATGAGEIHLADEADYAMAGSSFRSLTLKRISADWYETARDQVLAATQAQQESGTTSKVAVTPAVQHNHPSAAKAWCSVDRSAGTPSLNSPSYNISSVTDDGDGQTIVNLDTDMSGAVYTPGAAAETSGANFGVVHTLAAGSFKVKIYSDGGAAQDTVDFTCWAFGDQ